MDSYKNFVYAVKNWTSELILVLENLEDHLVDSLENERNKKCIENTLAHTADRQYETLIHLENYT